ncbi:MAG: heme lyase CcmF/NrfE family subunit [Chloroflexi bacterium]|nr:heme lyase CcmF/NrfE family subunit [Chloroflexota bacterium]MBI5704497.1 heme lyase CcmF/NrfE family subunit [Chloroflexota bacterium]
MIEDIGLITLTIAFTFSLYATFVSAYGGWRGYEAWVESARNAVLLVFPLLTISVVIVVYALYTLDFSLAYVYDVSSQAMSPFLRVTALWGGQQGSVLFWAWMMAGFVAVVLVRKWERDREMMPYFIATAMLTTTFFVGVVLFITNPFMRLWHIEGADELTKALFQPANSMPYFPEDGGGLNPLLRHFGMIGHPPTTYLGFTGFVIPFSFAIAALITGHSRGDEWIRTTRRWTLVAWIFLSIGLILGGRWAYDVLGWGGFWGWDPVENAMLMPWLTGTAFLHSVMMTEKRGMMKKWNMILIILTYSLSLFGTFITRTGVISSVHAFSKSALGPAFFAFIGLTFLGSVTLLYLRWDTLKSEHTLESFISRESAFVLQNMLFLAITFAVFWGTVFPLISELVTGTKITVGPPYFQKATGPLFFVLVLLMGVAPLFAWRKQAMRALGKAIWIPFAGSLGITALWGYVHRMHPASILGLWLVTLTLSLILAEFWKGVQARCAARGENPLTALFNLIGRNHRRYGGYIIHIGVVLIALGFIGDANFKMETQGTVSSGESLTVGDYQLRFEQLRGYHGSDGREIVEAVTTLSQGGEAIRNLNPRRDYFVVQQQPVTIPGVYSTPGKDVYVLLVGWDDTGKSATFRIYVNPLINWVWIGGVMMILGTIIAAWSNPAQREATYVIRPEVLTTQPVPQEG